MSTSQDSNSAAGIALLLWSCGPEAPDRLATPFFAAAAAAALDWPVEVYFTARSVLLLRPGVAASLRPVDGPKTVLASMREAVAHGARFYACTDALRAHCLEGIPLIEECTLRGGAVQFMARAGDLRWRTLVF